MFFDDFSNPELGRYYEVSPGVGMVTRREGGLHYAITRAPDGPSDASDFLTLDSLGRPHSPTKSVVVRFAGTDWTLEACVEYDFPLMRNGRGAYLWLVHGDAGERERESVALVRYADIEPQSHNLSLVVYDPARPTEWIEIARPPADRYWLRITRAGSRVTVALSEDGRAFTRVLERSVRATTASHALVMNSQSFAGGASFALRSLALAGARPDPARERPPVFAASAAEVSAADMVEALRAGRDIDVHDCVVVGALDLGAVESQIASDVLVLGCRFTGSIVATRPLSVRGAMTFLGCRFGAVGLAGVEFIGPVAMVGCQFTGDTRFIGARYDGGANFSGCTFSEMPFFRMVQATRPVSFYHATFLRGADLSGALLADLSLSDVAVRDGGMTLFGTTVTGTLRLMVTLQRPPQPLGGEWELSNTRIGHLVVSAGDPHNRRDHTGPAHWNLESSVYLRNARVDRLEFHRVHLAGVLDLSGADLPSRELGDATFTRVVGEWPVQSEHYSCFLSYSSRDGEFAERLRADLEAKGVRSWFAKHDMEIGEEIRQTIHDAIRTYDKLLLVLSAHAVRSDWVQEEVEAAFELERRQKRGVLIPIRLDAAVDDTEEGWASAIRQGRNIGDFSRWRDPGAYDSAFQRLLRALEPRTRHSS